MSNRRVSRGTRAVLIVIPAILVLAIVLGIIWWKTVSDLSLRSADLFAAEIQNAARDSSISSADLDLLRQLQTLAAAKSTPTLVRSFCVGVGMAPLLRGSITEQDRQDMAASVDFLARKSGQVSLSQFLRANPRIDQTFRGFRSLVRARARGKTDATARPVTG